MMNLMPARLKSFTISPGERREKKTSQIHFPCLVHAKRAGAWVESVHAAAPALREEVHYLLLCEIAAAGARLTGPHAHTKSRSIWEPEEKRGWTKEERTKQEFIVSMGERKSSFC